MSASPIRVAMIFPDAFDDYSYALGKELAKRVELIMISNQNSRGAPSARKIVIRHVGPRMFASSYPLEAFIAAISLKKLRPSVIYLPIFYPFLGYFLFGFTRAPIVTTVHYTMLPNMRGGWYGRLTSLLLWRVFLLAPAVIHRSKRIIVLSQSLKEELVAKLGYSEDKVDVIPHGPIAYGQVDAPEEEESNHVLFFGNLWWSKGLDRLLNSMLQTKSEFSDFKLTIAGGGKMPKEWLDLIEKCRQANFQIDLQNRFIKSVEVDRLFRSSTVVALPYRFAMDSGVLHTAYAYGKPVVASKTGYFNESVRDGETGFLVDENETPQFMRRIRQILEDKKLRTAMKRNIGEYVQQNQWSHIAELHSKSFRLAVQAGAPPGERAGAA